jgi:hypothetical protein
MYKVELIWNGGRFKKYNIDSKDELNHFMSKVTWDTIFEVKIRASK